MRRNNYLLIGALAALCLAACETAPRITEPPRRLAAFEIEQEGAQRYERGDLAGAETRLSQAERLFTAIDDAPSVARIRRHRAQVALSSGENQAALSFLTESAPDDVAALALRTQAYLGLGDLPHADATIAAARRTCSSVCPQLATLDLLAAHSALSAGKPQLAAQLATSAVALLRQQTDQPAVRNELANALRMAAQAQLAGNAAVTALPLADEALALDRQLAIPEKIVRDWLLLGHIRQKLGAGEAAQREAFLTARRIAAAVGRNDLVALADAALNNLPH